MERRSAKLVHLGPIANEVNPQVDPFEAGHLATAIASKSVSALGLESVPNTSDILQIRDNIQR